MAGIYEIVPGSLGPTIKFPILVVEERRMSDTSSAGVGTSKVPVIFAFQPTHIEPASGDRYVKVFHEGILAHPACLLRADEPDEGKHGNLSVRCGASFHCSSRGVIKSVAKQAAEKRNKAKKKPPSGAEAH